MPETPTQPTAAQTNLEGITQEGAPAQTQGTPPETEAKPPEPPAAKPDDQLSPRFARIAQKERDIRAREQALKDKDAEYAEIKRINDEYEALKAKAKGNPIVAMEKVLGVTFDELTQFALKHGREAPVDVEAMIQEATEKTKEELRREREEKERKDTEAYVADVIDKAKKAVTNTINSNPDDYELVIAYKAHDDVYKVIETVFSETGEAIDVAVAAKYVEDELFKKTQDILKLKKFAPAPLVDPPNGASKPSDTAAQVTSTPAPTLTKTQVQSGARNLQGLTDKERFNRALAKLEGRNP